MISRVLSTVLLPVVWSLVAENTTVTSNSTISSTTTIHFTVSNTTTSKPGGHMDDPNSSMVQRALYVLIGITTIGVLYFLVRAVRLKKPSQRKKYGLLKNYDERIEMDAVESDEDETLYEARRLRSLKGL